MEILFYCLHQFSRVLEGYDAAHADIPSHGHQPPSDLRRVGIAVYDAGFLISGAVRGIPAGSSRYPPSASLEWDDNRKFYLGRKLKLPAGTSPAAQTHIGVLIPVVVQADLADGHHLGWADLSSATPCPPLRHPISLGCTPMAAYTSSYCSARAMLFFDVSMVETHVHDGSDSLFSS